MTITRRLLIHGRVQGVGYRYSMVEAARALAIVGWVRNRRDGTVEALVQGAPSSVDKIIDWARHGPEMASVSQMDVIEETSGEQHASFRMLATL